MIVQVKRLGPRRGGGSTGWVCKYSCSLDLGPELIHCRGKKNKKLHCTSLSFGHDDTGRSALHEHFTAAPRSKNKVTTRAMAFNSGHKM
jgi:hypothetical protein